MKNSIYLNYGFKVDKFYNKENLNFIIVNNEKVFIKEINNEKLDNLFELTNNLYKNNIKVNTFIINKNNNIISTYKDKHYVLYKENRYIEKVTLNELMKFWNVYSSLEHFDIIKNWENEIDIIEQEIIEYNNEYKIITNSLNYYIGMAENAIELLNHYKNIINDNNNSIGHNYKTTLDSDYLDNPFNFIKTNKMYDVALYFKNEFFNNSINYDDINYIIINNNEYENTFLFSCLLYPDYYFDLVKKVLNKREEEVSIEKLIKKIKTYQKFLCYCQNQMKNSVIIRNINWIKD